MIDWNKLKLYKIAKWKSFEELCYQIANQLYENSGKFTPIDDSGGGDGVEFYLTFPNGDEWGWQAKFYYPDIRLGVSNRKDSIKKSLDKSIKVHCGLKKWFLCTPSDFTTKENNWFNQTLKNSAPNVELQHWGDSEFLNYLCNSEFVGIKKNFFGELELDINWFSLQAEKQISNVKDKFLAELHTETEADFKIHCLLGDSKFKEFVKKNVDEAKSDIKDFQEEGDKFEKTPLNNIPSDIKEQILKIIPLLKDKDNQEKIIQSVQDFSNLVENGFIKQALDFRLENTDKLRKNIEELTDVSISIYKLAQESPKEKKDSIFYIGHKLSKLSECLDEFNIAIFKIEEAIHNFKNSELYIFGGAVIGKTHIACHICEQRIKNNLPSILLLGRDFTKDKTIERKILEILDIEAQYSWSDFILALESAADAYKTRIPIVIDALNESETVDVWKNQLSGFIESLKNCPHIVLITTCRTLYIDAIWENRKPKNCIYTHGFSETNLEEAINKYFNYYKLKADLTLAPLSHFRHPIYLRIFCEVKNPERKEEKQIYVGEQTLFEVLDEYLQNCNRKISEKLLKPPKLNFIQDILKRFAGGLWASKSRQINYTDAIRLIDNKDPSGLDWNKSFTMSLLNEGLLISRSWIDGKEKVSFTSDLLGGYLIASHLLDRQGVTTVKKLIESKEFEENLLNDDYTKLHPLFEDILRSICALLPGKFGKHLYQLSKNKRAFNFSILALFEITPSLIKDNSVKLLEKLFNISENRKLFLKLLKNTARQIDHPLNAEFLNKLLRNLSVSERDLSWTEFVRERSSEFRSEIEKFENTCKITGEFSEISKQRFYLTAQYFSWLLTSTDRVIRDKTTRVLYWFGRKFPEKLFELTEKSLVIDDPYLPERMLAASYGVAMALHGDISSYEFRKKVLSQFAKRLYSLMFKKGAPYSTTHILMRDYARHTIEIALLHNSKLLDAQEKKRIKPPFKGGGIRRWEREKDRNENEYRDSNYPFGFDFDNYTIGSMIPNRGNYDFRHPEYIKVKENMWWRIYNLGYSLQKFGEIDKEIARAKYFGQAVEEGKIDRYGKKYCWIAFYEIAGYRADKGLLNDWYIENGRISDIDIDPSFPEKPQKIEIIEKDYLKGGPKDLAKWIDKGPTPDISDYLILTKINDIEGPWVLLDGYICQENYENGRGVFVFLRGLLINKKDIKKFIKYKDNISVKNRALPEIEGDHYTFAGEIPWCETFPYTVYPTKIEIPISAKIVKMPKKEVNNLNMDVEIPIREFCWESYHSVVNPGQSFYVPSKEISTELGLHIEPQSFDMVDKEGRKASITLRWGDPWHTTHELIYLRKDLLEKYLTKGNKELTWIIWGEREYRSKDNEGLQEFAQEHKSYQVYKSNIFLFSQIANRDDNA